MFRTAIPFRALAVLAVGVLALGALAFRPQPAAAQVVYSEYLITTTTITRTQPSMAAPIYTTLYPNTLVYVVNRFFTADGYYWFQLRDPAGNYLGFVPVSGPGVSVVPFQSAGTGIIVGGFPRYVTGVSPYLPYSPFIYPNTIITVPRVAPSQIFVPSVGFFQ